MDKTNLSAYNPILSIHENIVLCYKSNLPVKSLQQKPVYKHKLSDIIEIGKKVSIY